MAGLVAALGAQGSLACPAADASPEEAWHAPAQTFIEHVGPAMTQLDELLASSGCPAEGQAKKQLARARMLETVISSKWKERAVKLDNFFALANEWLMGLLDATFVLETKLVDSAFADRALYDQLLAVLDEAGAFCSRLTATFAAGGQIETTSQVVMGSTAEDEGEEGEGAAPTGLVVEEVEDDEGEEGKDTGKPAAAADTEGEGEDEQAKIRAMVQKALADGTATWKPLQSDGPGAAPETQALGADLWEAICWRRGTLRYYLVATVVKEAKEAKAEAKAKAAAAAAAAAAGEDEGEKPGGGAGDNDDDPEDVDAVGAAAGPHRELTEGAISELKTLLVARSEGRRLSSSGGLAAGGGDSQTAKLLEFGIFSDMHLLALAYLGDLCFWRWAAEKSDAEKRDAEKSDAEQLLRWRSEGVKYLRRYVLVVEDLMEGCGWSTDHARALLGILGGDDATRALPLTPAADGSSSVLGEAAKASGAAAAGGAGGGGDKAKKKGAQGKKRGGKKKNRR